ncbi:MAG: nucleotidyltransferase family protein, partial [Actinobacteria bacterium]|nr:nucleotidyltransferase family protein [Actinomycetota bacterium]
MDQAIILAGGQATRMRPYTDDRPKAMVEVAGAPIIEHQIGWLRDNGVKRLVVSCGYKAEVIQEHISDGTSLGDEVTYAVEDEPLGRGGGLKFAAKRLADTNERWHSDLLDMDRLSRVFVRVLHAIEHLLLVLANECRLHAVG